MDADDAEYRRQQNMLNAYALDPGTMEHPGSYQQQTAADGSDEGSSSFRSSLAGSLPPFHNPLRIVGMSATLPNAEEVSGIWSG